STVRLLEAMRAAGYRIEALPPDGQALVETLLEGATNQLAGRAERAARVAMPLEDYEGCFQQLPATMQKSIVDRWGAPEADPHVSDGAFVLALLPLGNVVVGIQPARG